MLEVTGGRRGEIAEIRVSDIYAAYKMQSPHLKLHTLKKKKSDSIRYIPISKNDLKVAIEFIEKNRSIVIDNTVGSNGDQGYLFISKTQGARLKDNTITQELSLIAKSACIKVQACPHLFRHRFITKMFISLIEHHKILNAESFLSNELDIQMLQTKAIEASGHASMSSLTPYLHIAYAEVRKISKTFDESMRSNFVSSAISGLKICKDMLEHGTQPVELIERIEVLVNHLLDDNNWSSPHNPQTF